MAVKLVTGYKGKDHVTAEQWADFNRGIFGDAAILPVGNKMETTIQTANQITVKDGVAVIDGRQVYIAYGESENISIQSGTQGMLRRDIVVLEYTRDEDAGVEDVKFKVINGTPASGSAKDPAINNMDIRTGVSVSQKPFCRVRLNGTAIEGVDSLVPLKELKPHAFAAVVDSLDSSDGSLALSARQGMELKKKVNEAGAYKGSATQDNFDDIKTQGTYSINPSITHTNHPYPGKYGVLEVVGDFFQRFTAYDSEGNIQEATRAFSDHKWTPWDKEEKDNIKKIIVVSKTVESIGTSTSQLTIDYNCPSEPVAVIPIPQGGGPFMCSVNTWSKTQAQIGLKAIEELKNRRVAIAVIY